MQVNLQQLRVFYYVVQHSSMAAAARMLFISRPAVTMHIRNFEDQLGFELFSVKRGHLKLTDRGREIYRFAQTIFAEVERLENYVESEAQELHEVLIFGAHHIMANYYLRSIVEHTRDFSPNLSIKIALGSKEVFFEKILDRSMHAAAIIGPSNHVQIVTRHLFDAEAVLVSAPHGFLTKKQKISARMLRDIPLILPQKNTGFHTAVVSFLQRYDVTPPIRLDNISSDIIKTFLLQHRDTAAFIPRYAVQQELHTGVLKEIHIREGYPILPTNLAYLLQDPLPPVLRLFLDGLSSFSFHPT